MPPKVRTATPPEAMATQPDSPPEEPPETLGAADPAKPPKKKRGKAKSKAKASASKGRPSIVALVKHAIAEKVLMHPDVVQKFLDALDTVAVECLKTNGLFRMNFITFRIRTQKARGASTKRVCGKDIQLKAKPERRTLKTTPGKCLKALCQ